MPKIDLFKKNLKNNREEYEEGVQERLKNKLIRHRMLIFYRTVVLSALAVAILLGWYIFNKTRVYTDYTVKSDLERNDADTAIYIPYDKGNVIKYSQDGAEAFDGKNNAIWNITFEMQKPQIVTNGEWVALGDFKGNRIYVVNKNGISSQIDTKYPVSSFCIAGQGVVAAVLEGDEQMKINIYSPGGDLLVEMKCTMANSGYPIDMAISNDGMKLGVSYVRLDNGKLKSSVAFYNFGEVGKNEIDNYVSGYDYVDTVVPKIEFLNNDTAFALGDNRLVIYKGSQKPVSAYDTFVNEEIKSVYYGENKIALVFRDTEGKGTYRVDVYDDKGNIKLRQYFDLEYTDMVLTRDCLIMYNDKKCQMYRMGGQMKFDGIFEESVMLLVPSDALSKWTLVSKNNVKSVVLE